MTLLSIFIRHIEIYWIFCRLYKYFVRCTQTIIIGRIQINIYWCVVFAWVSVNHWILFIYIAMCGFLSFTCKLWHLFVFMLVIIFIKAKFFIAHAIQLKPFSKCRLTCIQSQLIHSYTSPMIECSAGRNFSGKTWFEALCFYCL